MDHKQPNVVNVRNGPSRGRSRSISRSLSRSRSRSPRRPRRVALHGQPAWPHVANGHNIFAGLYLRRDAEEDSTVTLRQMKAVVGPKTDQALTRLLKASYPDYLKIKLDDAPARCCFAAQ